MCIIDCLSTIVFILPLHLDYTKVIILILWWRNFQLEYWRTFQLVSTGIHVGYEHNYELRSGWTLYWQVKSDMMIKGADLLRTGIVLGVKLPIK